MNLEDHIAKRAGKPRKKQAPKKDRAWFGRKVAELKTELEKLPADSVGRRARNDISRSQLN